MYNGVRSVTRKYEIINVYSAVKREIRSRVGEATRAHGRGGRAVTGANSPNPSIFAYPWSMIGHANFYR